MTQSSERRTLVRLCIGGYQGWTLRDHRATYARAIRDACAARAWRPDTLLTTHSRGGLDAITAHFAKQRHRQHIEIATSHHHQDATSMRDDNLASLCDAAIIIISEDSGEGRGLIGAMRRHNKPYTIVDANTLDMQHVEAR
jgi:hypothetical protein